MRFFQNMPIRFKLFFTYALMAVVIFSVTFALLFSQVHRHLESRIKSELTKSNQTITDLVEITATVSIKNYLRAIADKQHDMLKNLYQDQVAGHLSESDAQQQAIETLLAQKIGKSGYIYCVNSQGVIVVHPGRELPGQNLSDQSFIQEQVRLKDGYLEYEWQNPGEKKARAKALHMTYFEPWDWIVSISAYKSDFSRLVNVDDFKDRILQLSFGQTGYAFIFDTQGNSVIHPVLTGSVLEMTDKNGTPIFQQMIQQQKGFLTYYWENPQDPQPREKFLAFDFIPDFNWIVASSVYTSEAFSPLVEMRKTFLLILILAFFITAIVTLVISATITKPLTQLILSFETGAQDNWEPIFVDDNRKDEIGQLSNSFNRFMKRLKRSRQKLAAENRIRRETQTQLKLFEKVFQNANEGITITDDKGDIEVVNPAFTAITGYLPEEAIGNNPRILKSDRHDDAFYRAMWDSLIENGSWTGEIWNRRKTGEAFPEFLSINAIYNRNGRLKNYVAIFHDISEMKTKEKQIEHMAYHDPLTGLPNRTLLKDRLEQAIATATRSKGMIQVLFIDLDNFKNVNDSIGHAKGDELLKQVAGRLLSVTRVSDTVSRLGGDEFIIMVPNINNMMEIIFMVERVQEELTHPFSLGDHTFHISCSIGVCVYPNDGNDAETLIRNADLAMYQSKNSGKDKYHLFEVQMAQKVRERVEMEASLRTALENNEFQVYFQPQVNNQTLLPVGIEALVRWVKPDGTTIPPGQFIPLAEESGLIVPLGEKIFRSALVHANDICIHTGMNLSVAVNVSARQFDDNYFEEMVSHALDDTGFPANRLKIEITESLLIKENDIAMARLKRLSEIGILTEIDDFGTGYSSLAYIKKLPISTLKIDKSFIDGIPNDPDDIALVETIVLMANKLKIGIVAEGVETPEQLQALRLLGDMDIQGYLFARPMPPEQIKTWILKKIAET